MPPPQAQPRHLVLRFVVALLLAVVLHLLLLGLLAVVVEVGGFAPQAEIQAIRQVTESSEARPAVSKTMAADTVPTPLPQPPQVQDFSIHGTVPLPTFERIATPTMTLGAAHQVFNGGGGMGVPLAMRNRFDPDQRLKLLLERGGLPEAEDAVLRALDWLMHSQNADGSWGTTYKVAMTGLAVLCFLGHGDTPESATYGGTVSRGVDFLTERSTKNNGLMATAPNSSGACYEHGIATYALGEVYALARFGQKNMGPVVEGFDKGVNIILKGQTEAGGWLYNYSPGPKGDMSVTGWQYQALNAARQTRLHFPTLEQQIHKTERFLLNMRGPKGGFGYTGPTDRASLTGVGVLGLQLFDPQEHRAAIIAGLQFIFESYGKKKWSNADVYAWYYNTQAAFHFGGTAWERWNAIYQKELLHNQKKDGHWSHPSAQKAKDDADIFCTVLCTLMLEVYYRYQPPATR